MRGRLTALLLSRPLLLSLAALLANDLYLKYAFPGWLTGKLSDFAGIFLVSYLAFGLLPRWRGMSALTIGVLFTAWKSPLSQPLLDAINAIAPVQFVRVIDYWDLLAFLMMPLAVLLQTRLPQRPRRSRMRSVAAVPIAAATLVAISATSVYMPTSAFRIQSADAEYVMDESRVAAIVERVANDYGAECERGNADVPSMACDGPDVWMLYLFDETTGTAQFLVTSTGQDGIFLPKPDPYLLGNVLHDLKAGFARMAPNMEYVEALEEDSYQQFADFIERVCGEDSYCEKE